MAISKLKPSELVNFLNYIIKNNMTVQEEQSGKPVTVNIIGEAGLGKTSIVQQVAEENNKHFVKLNLAQIEELGDLVGFPIKQFELCKEDKCIWVNEPAIPSYEKEGYHFTGKSRTSYAAPEWIVGYEESDKGGILLLDDWTRADVRFIQACMELIDRQEYISWKLPKGWTILLTSNPNNGEYTVTEMDEAQKTRFLSVELDFDAKEWSKWAEYENIDGRCINFLIMNPEIIKNKGVNPRSLVNFFTAIKGVDDFQKNLPLIQMIGEGAVGDVVSNMFVSFINNKLDKLPTPEDIFNAEDSKLERDLIDVIGVKGTNYRQDIASTLALRVTNFSLALADKGTKSPIKIDNKFIDRITFLVEKKMFGADLGYMMVRSLFQGSTKFRGLAQKQSLIEHITR